MNEFHAVQNVLQLSGAVLVEQNQAQHSGGALWIVGNSVAKLSGPQVTVNFPAFKSIVTSGNSRFSRL